MEVAMSLMWRQGCSKFQHPSPTLEHSSSLQAPDFLVDDAHGPGTTFSEMLSSDGFNSAKDEKAEKASAETKEQKWWGYDDWRPDSYHGEPQDNNAHQAAGPEVPEAASQECGYDDWWPDSYHGEPQDNNAEQAADPEVPEAAEQEWCGYDYWWPDPYHDEPPAPAAAEPVRATAEEEAYLEMQNAP